MRSCDRPRRRPASEALPASVSNRYALSTRTHGSSCRRRANSSLRRVSSFSVLSSLSRAASHSSRVPVMCVVIGPLRRVVFGGRETDWERESNGGSDKCGAIPMDSLTHASGRVKTVQGAAMPRSTCSPSGTSGVQRHALADAGTGAGDERLLPGQCLADLAVWHRHLRQRFIHAIFGHLGSPCRAADGPAVPSSQGSYRCPPRARSRLNAALIRARWVKAWGKLPSASPRLPVSSAYRPTWLAKP